MTQILSRLTFAPDIQAAIPLLPRPTQGRDAIKETDVRPIAAIRDWCKKHRPWAAWCYERLPSTDGSQ